MLEKYFNKLGYSQSNMTVIYLFIVAFEIVVLDDNEVIDVDGDNTGD